MHNPRRTLTPVLVAHADALTGTLRTYHVAADHALARPLEASDDVESALAALTDAGRAALDGV